MKTIPKAAKYVGIPIFGPKKVQLELPGRFDRNLAALNTWLFEIEQYCQIVRLKRSSDMVKLAVSGLEKDAHTWWR